MQPAETIARFDAFLAAEGLRREAIVIGGTALGLLGLITSCLLFVSGVRPRH